MLPQEQYSKMTYICVIATFLAIFVLPAGFLAIVTGFAALDEIQKYHYKGKRLAYLSIAGGGLFFIMHILLINVYKTNTVEWVTKLLEGGS